MRGITYVIGPPETHPFLPSSKDNYYCATCRKPRAVHLHDGFTPNHNQPHCSMWQEDRYGSHKYWYGLGWDRKKDFDEQDINRPKSTAGGSLPRGEQSNQRTSLKNIPMRDSEMTIPTVRSNSPAVTVADVDGTAWLARAEHPVKAL